MEIIKKNKLAFLVFLFFLPTNIVSSDTDNIEEILKIIQKDLKILEKAVYSDSFSNESENLISNDISENYSEDALTRHLLKL